MSEEKLDKLLSIMLEMKKSHEEFRKETNKKLDKIASDIDLP